MPATEGNGCPVQTVMRIDELVKIVIECVDSKHDLFNCALACSTWTTPASRLLWRELPSLDCLYHLLHTTVSPIPAADFHQFQKYAIYVKTLFLGEERCDLSSILDVADRAGETGRLFPNLNRVEMIPKSTDKLHQYLRIVDEQVVQIALDFDFIRLDSTDTQEPLDFLHPRLNALELYNFRDIRSLDIFSSIHDLEFFACSHFMASLSMIKAMSQLPNLHSVSFDTNNGTGPNDSLNDPFSPMLDPGSFPMLVDLSFCSNFDDAVSFLNVDFAPMLKSLCLYSPTRESAASLNEIIGVITIRRPSLTTLSITSESIGDGFDWDRDVDRVTLNTLRPLLILKKIQVLRLSYHRTLMLNNDDVKTLVSAWPDLRSLDLCSDPTDLDDPIMTPAILTTVATHCPLLLSLSLYLGTWTAPPSSDLPRFPYLEAIRFGTSPLPRFEIKPLVEWLGRMLPPSCDIRSLGGGQRFGGEYLEFFLDLLPEFSENWGVASNMLECHFQDAAYHP